MNDHKAFILRSYGLNKTCNLGSYDYNQRYYNACRRLTRLMSASFILPDNRDFLAIAARGFANTHQKEARKNTEFLCSILFQVEQTVSVYTVLIWNM